MLRRCVQRSDFSKEMRQNKNTNAFIILTLVHKKGTAVYMRALALWVDTCGAFLSACWNSTPLCAENESKSHTSEGGGG